MKQCSRATSGAVGASVQVRPTDTADEKRVSAEHDFAIQEIRRTLVRVPWHMHCRERCCTDTELVTIRNRFEWKPDSILRRQNDLGAVLIGQLARPGQMVCVDVGFNDPSNATAMLLSKIRVHLGADRSIDHRC